MSGKLHEIIPLPNATIYKKMVFALSEKFSLPINANKEDGKMKYRQVQNYFDTG